MKVIRIMFIQHYMPTDWIWDWTGFVFVHKKYSTGINELMVLICDKWPGLITLKKQIQQIQE